MKQQENLCSNVVVVGKAPITAAKMRTLPRVFGPAIIVTLLLTIVSVCLLGYILHSQSGIFRKFQAALLSMEWILPVCIGIWCGIFVCLTFSLKDLFLVGLLLIAVVLYFVSYRYRVSPPISDATILLACVTQGKGVRFFLKRLKQKIGISFFLTGLVVLFAFSSWWHWNAMGAYRGPRWMGLWDNPNTYGMLMGAGLVLATGLLAANRKSMMILFIAAGMMVVGLVFSYSRGAWLGAAVGLLYLAKSHAKFKWRLFFPLIVMVTTVVLFFWHSTADTDQWYFRRLDFSRPSAQHRVSAWRGALQMMRDHPLGVGWNQAVSVYEKDYSPPEGGAPALTTNSYLMLGTELGLPGLLCFVTYVGLCFRTNRRHLTPALSAVSLQPSSGLRPPSPVSTGEGHPSGSGVGIRPMSLVICHSSLQVACRAGAVVLLVAFWFDGGLFDLPTAAVFWILLELGTESHKRSVITTFQSGCAEAASEGGKAE